MEIIVDWGIVTLATVALAWVVNSGIPRLGRLFGQAWGLSVDAKKGVAFLASVGLVYGFRTPVELPDPGSDLFEFVFALLAQAEIVFKTAQEVYDHVWKGILQNVRSLFG